MKQRFRILSAVVFAAAVLCIGPCASSALAVCGDFNTDGRVSSTDALGVLRVAVGSETCPLVRCDIDDSGRVTGVDALAVLKASVGQNVALVCAAAEVVDIADLPKATGPVVDPTSAGALTFDLLASATQGQQGIVLGELNNGSFNSDSSMAACEIANMSRIAVTSAAEADLILCYVQNIFESLQDQSIDIYDGQYHTFALDFGTAVPPPGSPPPPPGEGYGQGPAKVRMKIVRSASAITEFEMFTCSNRPSGLEQDEYIHQTIGGGDFSMIAKGTFQDMHGSDGHSVQVAGLLNDVGQFVGTKTISMAHSSVWGDGGTGFGEMVVKQRPALIDLNGYDGGSWTWEEQPGVQKTENYTNRVTAAAELLDLNVAGEPYDIGLLALGDGAAKLNMRNGDDFKWWDFTEIQGWDGETTALDNVNPVTFIDTVRANDLPDAADSVTISFGAGESWDCSDAAEAIVPVDQISIDAACANLQIDQNWLDCYGMIEGGGAAAGKCDPNVDPYCPDGYCDPNTPGDPDCGCDPNTPGDPNCGPPPCDPANDPYCPDGYCDPNTPGDPDCGPGCDPANDPYCPDGWCDPATPGDPDCGCRPGIDPGCDPGCDPATDPYCPDGWCDPNQPGDPDCGCDPADPNCDGICDFTDPHDPDCGGKWCDPAVDPYCPDGYCDPNTPGDPDCGPPCDPAVDPNCGPGCDPAVDPNCPDGYCDPNTPGDPDCGGGCDPLVDPNCPDGWCDPNHPLDVDCNCDPTTDPYCPDGYCDPNLPGDPDCGCGPGYDPNCNPGCDPAVDPYCPDGYCDPNTPGDPDCGPGCDPAVDPNCPDGYCDPNTPGDPDCGPPCDPATDPNCGCDPATDPNCGGGGPPCDPAVDQYCFPHPIDACWDPNCTCLPGDPGCVDQCFDTTCDPCWDATCTCSPSDALCPEACWDPTCGYPCLGADCGG